MVRIANSPYSLGLYFGLLLAYFATGHLLSNFSFQSQIVPIWLPAGIALVGCYIWWWRFVPAVFIASFAFNFSIQASDDSIGLLADQGLGFCLIAFGASLQAVVGSGILRYWLGHPLKESSYKKIIYFIFIVGILVNLISANIGILSLSIFNPEYSLEHYWNNLLYWWLGDSLGVLLVTPFILSLISIDAIDKAQKRSRLLILSSSAVLFLSVLVLTGFFIEFSNDNAKKSMAREVKSIENGLYRELNNSMAQLQNLASYIQNTPQLERKDFIAFVNELVATQPTIAAMSWNPMISQDEKIDHQMELRGIYNKEVIIRGTPILTEDPIVYVRLIAPEEANSKAIGFNVFSNKDRKKTLINSESSFQSKATPIIQLVQSEEKTPAYLMFFPVFEGDKKLIGFATGVFLAEDMLLIALDTNGSKQFDYELYEAGNRSAFSSNNETGDVLKNDKSAEKLEFKLTEQVWELYLKANKEFLSQQQSESYLLLFSLEFVIVTFIMLLILMMNSRQIELNVLVTQKTQSLKLAVQEANNANSAKSRFLANMSHEIRTPMNAVIGFSQLARKSDDLQTVQGYLEKIEISSDLLLNIVNDILDISKIEANKLVLSYENFDIHKSIQRIDSLFSSQAESKKLSWSVINNIPKSLYFKGDQVRLEQVLVNLCSNSLKFTKQGSIKIIADVKIINKDKNQITIKVKDSGIGISEEKQQKLFSAFTQADDSTSRKFGGTGLGLALSKELSRLMQGDISIESKESEGSEFTFLCYMPSADNEFELLQAELKNTTAFEVKSSLKVSSSLNTSGSPDVGKSNATNGDRIKNTSRMHVLVAEDNEINQLVIEAILENNGITADIVSNGKKAVDKIQENAYDAVLMDCQMPVMDGYTATQAIRKLDKFKDIPIFALTADATPESKSRAKESGFTGHLSKPIMVEELMRALEGL